MRRAGRQETQRERPACRGVAEPRALRLPPQQKATNAVGSRRRRGVAVHVQAKRPNLQNAGENSNAKQRNVRARRNSSRVA